MNTHHAIKSQSNHLTFWFTSSHQPRLYRGQRQPRGHNLRKRIKIELEDEEGTKYTLALEGAVSRDKLMKAMDMLEVMDVPLEHSHRVPDEGTFFGKVQTLLETTFAAGDFSSSDVAREFEDKYGQPVKLSTISTYLARLADKQYIKRERFGNSWVYRRVYLKPAQVAER